MAIQNRAALLLLQDKTAQAVEAAQKVFAQALKKVDDANNQLRLLQEYKAGYEQGLQAAMEKGLTIDTLQNYQRFIHQLDEAITAQMQVIEMAQSEQTVYRSRLQVVQKKKLSYDVLIARADKAQMQAALKQDQKMMDEFAMRASRKATV